MLLLFFFAFLSGLVTIAAPCIWPILPLVLSTTTTGGHKKPLGVTLGILTSFGLLTLFLSSIIAVIPFNATILRYIAVVVIAVLGVSLLVPKISVTLEGWVSRLQNLFPQKKQASTGLIPGFFTGLTLGIVWTPCAGPILAAIATLAATQKLSIGLILVTLFYCIGVGIPLFLFATVGRKLFTKSKFLSQYTGRIQQIFGVIMLVTALLVALNYDTYVEAQLLNFFPSYTQFLDRLEGNSLVTQQLNQLRKQQSLQSQITDGTLFNANYLAPDFVGITKWLNLNGQTVPSIKSLKGKVVLVDFWTYTCINCIRTLPHVTSWYDRYKQDGFEVIGIHTPEFAFEHETQNVLQAIGQYNIHYPVGQDNNYATWNNYTNQYWPAEYLIDAQGNVRRTEFGEGEYDQTEKAIQALLMQSGKHIALTTSTLPDTTPTGNISPETYLGSNRMQYYFPSGALANGMQQFTMSNSLPINSFSLGGAWTINPENAIAGNAATINYHFQAQNVYIILRPPSSQKQATVTVLLDGKPIGTITVDSDRLYNLTHLPKIEDHILELDFQTPGTQVYTFTFG